MTLIKKWDICAGNAILHALGGQLTDLAGKEVIEKSATFPVFFKVQFGPFQVDYSGHPAAEPKNEGGVLATMHHHREYLEALKQAVTTT